MPLAIPVKIALRLDREIHGLLADLGIETQRTGEFVDQEDMVERFTAAWIVVLLDIEEMVIAQVERGKTAVKV